MILAGLIVAGVLGGCIQTSQREVIGSMDPNGALKVHTKVSGADTQIATIKASMPNGFTFEMDGMSAQDKVAAVSAQQNMLALQLLAGLIEKFGPLLATAATEAPTTDAAKAPAKKAAAPRLPRKAKVPATQPTVKK